MLFVSNKQWGTYSSNEKQLRIDYPIIYSSFCIILSMENDKNDILNYRCCPGGYSLEYFYQTSTRNDNISFNRMWISLGV